MSNAVILGVDRQVLKKLLLIPDEVRLEDLYYDITSDTLKLKLVGEEFPPHDPGIMLPVVVAQYGMVHFEACGHRVPTFRCFRDTLPGGVGVAYYDKG